MQEAPFTPRSCAVCVRRARERGGLRGRRKRQRLPVGHGAQCDVRQQRPLLGRQQPRRLAEAQRLLRRRQVVWQLAEEGGDAVDDLEEEPYTRRLEG